MYRSKLVVACCVVRHHRTNISLITDDSNVLAASSA